jgi:AMMECR1 domain-containing protein
MARATPRLKRALPWTLLPGALRPAIRRSLAAQLRALASWQRTLRRWPHPSAAPDATPFVSLYSGGRLLGCMGSGEGSPGERVQRAFLHALHDPRVGPGPLQREHVNVELGYLTEARALPRELATAIAQLEVGTHGLAWLAPDVARSALLLPQVSRDHGWDAAALVDALCNKAGVQRDDLARGTLYRLSAETIAMHAERERDPRRSPAVLAARWLAALVAPDGAIGFAIDPRGGERQARGLMYHGRAAVVLEALRGWPEHRRRHAAAARRLHAEIAAGLDGDAPPGWPDDEPAIAGTLALAIRAGLPFADALLARAGSAPLASSAWHGAQVVAALGTRAPDALWAACVADLDARPFAPWTALAALARGDRAIHARIARTLVAAIAARGGVASGSVPELALTALTVEALAAGPATSEARAAVARGRAFLARWQFVPGCVPAALEPRAALGAFPLSPVVSVLRCDVTAHCLLALNRNAQ